MPLGITEASGIVTSLRGENLQYGTERAWQRFGLLASIERLQKAALERLANVR
jgi:hypothetical protein